MTADDIRPSRPEERASRLFASTGRHFVTYFAGYAQAHRQSWPALKAEYANLLTAVDSARQGSDARSLLLLRDVLQPHVDRQGYWRDSVVLSEWASEVAQQQGDLKSVARFAHDRADILNQLGQYAQAESLYHHSEETYLLQGEHEMALRSRHMRALVVRAQGRLTDAERLCEDTIRQAEQLHLDRWLAHPLYMRAVLVRDRGDFRAAKKWIQECLLRLDDSGEQAMVAQCHHFMGELALIEGQRTAAHFHLELSLRLSQEAGILRRVAATQTLLGDLAELEGRTNDAAKLFQEALATASRLGDRHQEARILTAQARSYASARDIPEALRLIQIARTIYEAIGNQRGVVGAAALSARWYFAQMRVLECARQISGIWKTVWQSGLLSPQVFAGMIRRRWRW